MSSFKRLNTQKYLKVENSECSAESNPTFEKSIMPNACKISCEEGTGVSGGQNITNINSDCMELIFEYLEFNDLVNVADSSKQFYNAVCQVYKRKYQNMIPVHANTGSPPYLDTDVLENYPRIIIRNSIILLKLLRNFGHLIRNLRIDFWFLNTKICDAIENYLATYCSDSLERFEVVCKGRSKTPIENLQKPLKKLKAMRIHTDLNRQQNFVQFFNESNLPNLQYLAIRCLSDINPHEKIHHKNVEYLIVECKHMNALPFSFENLKHLNLLANFEVNDAFCEYIGNIKQLKTIKLQALYRCWSADLLDKLLQNVPLNVEKIQFELRAANYRKMSIETISNFIKQSRNLRKFSFILTVGSTYGTKDENTRALELWLQELSLKLSEEWQSYMMDGYKYIGLRRYKCYVIERKTT